MKIDKIPVFCASIIVAALVLWFSSCKHDLGLPEGSPEICFDSLVMPIFEKKCDQQGCHDGTGEATRLTKYEEIYPEVTPGNPDQSPIYQAITGKGEGLMPPGAPLSLDNRTIIRLWILQDALHTKCDTLPPIKK